MGDFDDYQKAMLSAYNKLLQTLKVAVATLHNSNEISMQLHQDLKEVTPLPLLQEVAATVRLCCASSSLHAVLWPCSAALSPSNRGCLLAAAAS